MKQLSASIRTGVLLALIMAGCARQHPPDEHATVATVGEFNVTVAQLQEALQNDFRNLYPDSISLADKTQTLDKLIDVRRKAAGAVQEGYDQDSTYLDEIANFSNRTMAISLYNAQVIDALLPPAFFDRCNEWYFDDVKAVVVKVGFEQAATKVDRSEAEAWELAEKYLKELQISRDPEAAAATLTDGNKKTVLFDPYRFGQLPMKGDSLIYSTPVGKVGGPLKMAEGLVMVRVLDKKKREKDRSRKSIRDELLRIYRAQIRKDEVQRYNQISSELREKYQARVDEPGINQLVKRLEAWGKTARPQLSDFNATDRKIELAEVQGETIYSGDFFKALGSVLSRDYRMISQSNTIKERFVNQEVNFRCWIKEARTMGYDQNDHYRREMERYNINRLSQLFEQKAVVERVQTVSNKEVEDYYQANSEKYTTPERIELSQIVLPDLPSAETVLKRAKAGEDFKALFDAFVTDPRERVSHRFNQGYITRDYKVAPVMAAAFDAGANALVGPVEVTSEGKYYVLKTGAYQEKILKTLDKVLSSVRSTLINEKRRELREQLLEDIRAKIPARIDQNVLKRIG